MHLPISMVENSIVGLCLSQFDSIGLVSSLKKFLKTQVGSYILTLHTIGCYYLNHIGKRQPTSPIPVPSKLLQLLPVYLLLACGQFFLTPTCHFEKKRTFFSLLNVLYPLPILPTHDTLINPVIVPYFTEIFLMSMLEVPSGLQYYFEPRA